MADNAVTSVNGQTGKIELTSSDFGLQQEKWIFTKLDETVEEQQVVVKEVAIITFTINTTPFQAERGMTWGEFVDSAYNSNGFSLFENNSRYLILVDGSVLSITDTGWWVYSTDEIQPISYDAYELPPF